MTPRPLLLAAVLLGLAVVPFPQPLASASCAAPYLKLNERPVLERGATATVEGRAFVDGCRDSMSCSEGLGCDSCEYDDPPPKPLTDVVLRLVQGDRKWRLDVADAGTADDNQQGHVTWTFKLPADAKPGPAKLAADHAHPVQIRVR
ncbi:hypothetical protein [Nocardioides speluncae]|uniref:hypothetical protein n=1 Tax=Nocardioides speluncae TaxID=2670337 RepID=UPI000D694856|nr:hypothetical protein [Nocardioides speluncae]